MSYFRLVSHTWFSMKFLGNGEGYMISLLLTKGCFVHLHMEGVTRPVLARF